MPDDRQYVKRSEPIFIRGAYCAFGARERQSASVEIVDGYVSRMDRTLKEHTAEEINLTGYLLMPGFINAHDHLQFALHPRLADPPYQNYVEWGQDIHSKFAEIATLHRSVPKDVRLWWGGLRNLLCGVTTVCHHDKLWPELERADFPVRVVQRYGWGHSVALGGDLRHAHAITPEGGVFIMHACEGVDDQAYAELSQLDQLGLLASNTVLVHGLAMDEAGVALMQKRRSSLIVCPSSNEYLYDVLPNVSMLNGIDNVALGSDSPLTSEGDLLDEIRFALCSFCMTPDAAYRMVTTAPATILRLPVGAGTISESAPADLIAIRDTGYDAVDRLPALSMKDVEFVMIGGCVQLSSQEVWEKLSLHMKSGLEPLYVDGILRWLRAPVKELLQRAEGVLGSGQVLLSGRHIELSAAKRS
jgi:hypothetical protein